ncbi:MAG: MobA/MobL family protein, partial [Candidatus Aminicenantes bacterium]|nr:MobA/MobL family protein [Candidatus Aminicenantes bacterium]
MGAGLGGLSAAAAFARQGFKVLVLEQHSVPGGYASAFTRPGGFTFDVSLHSTTVGIREGIANLISGFPEIEDVVFVPHKPLYRAIYPDHDIRVPHSDVPAYVKTLKSHFPGEADGIDGIFADMRGFVDELGRLQAAGGQVDMSTFPASFPFVFKNFNRTWGAMLDDRIKDPKLKGVISGLWGYFGLPPSKVSTFYYAMPLMGYLEGGGYYPVGTSQKISDAFVGIIKKNGGEVKLNTRVEKILTRDHAAYGVRAADGAEYRCRAVISNANAVDTFTRMMDEKAGTSFSYRGGSRELVHEELALPDQVPAWLKTAIAGQSVAKASEALWNALDAFETRGDAQLARELIIALPEELTRGENIALVREFVRDNLTSKGMVADWVYHDKEGNPHIHLMTTLRPLTEEG